MRTRKLGWFAGITLLAVLAAGAGAQPGGDYLTEDLRARVEKLKADVATEPTNTTNREERARVLWAWANAYALDGGYLPVNLTQAVAAVFAYPDRINRINVIDPYVRELQLKDEQPTAIGELSADLGPFEARSFVTIRQTYQVGSADVHTGGGFVVARHFMPNYGRWQTADPQADNYISISSSNPSVSFITATAPMAGMHGGFRGVVETLMFRVAAGQLSQGDSVTITYGDTSGGSRGFLMADFSSDRMPLPLYLAFKDDGMHYSLPIAPIRVTGTRIDGVHGFAPSVVEPEETFTLSVRAQDRYYNRASGGHPGFKVLHGGATIAQVPAGEDAISLIEMSFSEPGVYHLEIESTESSIRGKVNPILVEDNPRRRIYWGDTHGHSGFAEGVGTPERFMIWARDDARLDFVTHSEHDIWLDDFEWEVLRANVANYSVEHQFIAYLGYEWTVRNLSGGHHNVLYRNPDRRERIPVQFYPTLSRLYAGLRSSADPRDVVIIPHAHQAGDYRLSDPELEPLVEIMSQHGNFEWFGRMYLNHGHEVGFTAASDNHLSQPGYSAPKNPSLAQRGGLGAVLASEKTTDALFDAMKSLNAYATSGERIILDVDVNGTPMGQRAPYSDSRRISGRVISTAPIDTITLIKNDAEIWHRDYLVDSADRLEDTETLLLSFASDSHPYHPGDNPRGWRIWRGTLTVENATLTGAAGRDFHNHMMQSLQIDADNPNLVRFATLSRGDSSSIALDLTGLRRSTRIQVTLEGARETGGAPPLYRPPQTLEAAQATLALRDLNEGQLRQPISLPGYEDSITLRRIIADGEMDVSFELTDEGGRQGDYYFIRVKQADDALAWSSPIWVGGHPSR